MRQIQLLGLVASASAVLAGCTSRGTTGAQAAPPAVTITASDNRFEVPAEVKAGVSTIRLVNNGSELHHVQLVKLEEGKTLQDLMAALAAGGPPPAWARAVGGPNAVAPGSSGSAVHNLEAGRYALLCFIPAADGVAHLMKGMEATMEVMSAGPSTIAEPEPDVVMTLVDYGFRLSTPVSPGQQVIRVVNEGPQIHEVVLARMLPGRHVSELATWELTGRKGPAPGELIGGVVGLSPGEHTTFAGDFTAGEYGLICFLPDSKDGKPHTEHGMVHQLVIEE